MTQWGLDNLFNPGKRHMDDEKRRLQSTREEIGDSSGGRRIDLEAGTVSISVPRSASTTDTAPEPDDDATALDPALEVEDVPALALANDEAEIEPEVAAVAIDDADPVDGPVAGPVDGPVDVVEDEPEVDDEPAVEPIAVAVPAAPEPTAPRRRVSAKAWSRGG